MSITCLDIEIAVAEHFNPRLNMIVPNISWGMGLHECDLLIVTPAGYAWEVEIKTNKQDLIKDKGKRHGHFSNRISRLYFAIPTELIPEISHIPERAGILEIKRVEFTSTHPSFYDTVTEIRKPKVNNVYKFSETEIRKFLRLGTMRIWPLKRSIRALNLEHRG